MFPDLRLLISATVATFFLAATAGLYASLRINQDQIAALAEARIIEDAPVTRIANGWPTPEPSRAAALRDLIRMATYPPIVAREEIVTDRSDVDVPQDATQSTMPETQSHAALKETPVQDATGSTGIATKQEPASAVQTDQPDIAGNIGVAATVENANARAEKNAQTAKKKVPQVTVTKKVRVAQRRRRPAPPPLPPADQLLSGYPLYLTVPVTN